MPDDLDARLVVLPAESPYSKENGSPAEKAARAILESRGNGASDHLVRIVTANSRVLGFELEFE